MYQTAVRTGWFYHVGWTLHRCCRCAACCWSVPHDGRHGCHGKVHDPADLMLTLPLGLAVATATASMHLIDSQHSLQCGRWPYFLSCHVARGRCSGGPGLHMACPVANTKWQYSIIACAPAVAVMPGCLTTSRLSPCHPVWPNVAAWSRYHQGHVAACKLQVMSPHKAYPAVMCLPFCVVLSCLAPASACAVPGRHQASCYDPHRQRHSNGRSQLGGVGWTCSSQHGSRLRMKGTPSTA